MKLVSSVFHLALHRRRLAALLALLPAALKAEPDSVLIFGDSAADQGNLHATAGYGPGPKAPYYRGADGLVRLSDGPMWQERLFPGLRSINSTGALGQSVNFAYGAATTGEGTFGAGEAGELPVGVQSQVAAYLALRAAKALPAPTKNSYAFIEAGPNDYFAALATGADLAAEAKNSPLRLAASAKTLAQAGLHTVFVTDTPDFAEAPLFFDAGLSKAQRDALSTIAATSRKNLRGELRRVQGEFGSDYRFVVLPVNALFRAILANPSAFGFSNVSGKYYDDTTDAILETNASKRSEYLFVDSLHLTKKAQAWQAQYYGQVIDAIDGTAQARFARLTDGLHGDAELMHRAGDDVMSGPLDQGRWEWFASARGGGSSESLKTSEASQWRSANVGTLFGARRMLTSKWSLGLAAGAFTEEGRISDRSLRWTNDGHGLWLLNRWDLSPVVVRWTVGGARYDSKLRRDPGIPTFLPRGKTDGILWSSRLEVERSLGRVLPAIEAGVVLGTSMSRSRTDGFTESGATGLALALQTIRRDIIISEAGIRLRADASHFGRMTLTPSVDLLISHDGGDRDTDVSAELIDNTSGAVRVSVGNGARTKGQVRFNCDLQLTKTLTASITDVVSVNSSDDHEHRIELGLSARF